MNKHLYLTLARDNLKRNRRLNAPFTLASSIMCAMFFIITNMVLSNSLNNIRSGSTMEAMLIFGTIIMAVFVIAYMFYINSFLIKQRKKEFGLYAVLGLEKRHIGRIVFWENLITNLKILVFGFCGGAVFAKLMFMLLMSATRLAAGSSFSISPLAFIITGVYFLGIFTMNLLYNIRTVRRSDPIELMREAKKGETKVAGVVPLTVLGCTLLGAAYVFSIMVKSTALAISFFWPAVMLVIIATFILFASGSQFVLGLLRKNKRYYYKREHFINTSTLIYRMKQNAAGLANIAILSTMVIVTVATCSALYLGQEKILRNQNPNDITVELLYSENDTAPDTAVLEQSIRKLAEETNVSLDSLDVYFSIRETVYLRNGSFVFKDGEGRMSFTDPADYGYIINAYIITQEDYNRLGSEKISLNNANEIALVTDDTISEEDLTANGSVYTVKKLVNDPNFTHPKNGKSHFDNVIYFIVKDESAAKALRKDLNPGYENDRYVDGNKCQISVRVNFTAANDETRREFAGKVENTSYWVTKAMLNNEAVYYNFSSIDLNRESHYAVYGGLLFLGIFFAALFLINTVTVIYFKQISEGIEDRERFYILQKVGMSDEEVKQTINSQVVTVFFLPLAAAVVNMLAATNIIIWMLKAFVMTDTALTAVMIAVTTLVFSIVYVVVFKITANAYYRIVRRTA